MLPVVDKPAIQYVVEEAVRAGLDDILIITGRNKRAIEDHFDRNFELEHYLEQAGKHDLLKEVQASAELAHIHYVRQGDPNGLGRSVMALLQVGDEEISSYGCAAGEAVHDGLIEVKTIVEKPPRDEAPSNLA